MSPLSIIVAAALAGLLAGFGGGWKVQAWRHDAAALAAEKKADAKEAEWQLIYKETNDAKESQLRDIALERDRFAGELRKRPNRLPEASLAACSGSSGAQLAAPDAGFLEGYGAFARSLQVELEACYKREAVN